PHRVMRQRWHGRMVPRDIPLPSGARRRRGVAPGSSRVGLPGGGRTRPGLATMRAYRLAGGGPPGGKVDEGRASRRLHAASDAQPLTRSRAEGLWVIGKRGRLVAAGLDVVGRGGAALRWSSLYASTGRVLKGRREPRVGP